MPRTRAPLRDSTQTRRSLVAVASGSLMPLVIAACQGSSFSSDAPPLSLDASTTDRSTPALLSEDSGEVEADADADTSAIDDGGAVDPQCDRNTPFGAPTRIVGLPESAMGFRLTPNERTGFFHVESTATPLIYRITRKNRLDNFDATTVKTVTFQQPALQADASTPYFSYAAVTSNEGRMYVASDYSIYSATKVNDGTYNQLTLIPTLVKNHPAYSLYTMPYVNPNDDTLYMSTVLLASGATHVASVNGAAVSAKAAVDLGTASNNRSLVVTSDGTLAYFSSWRESDGSTFYQIWTGSRDNTAVPFSNLTPVVELRSPNTTNDPTYVSNDGCRLYFQSNRGGSMNTYLAERSPL